MVHDFLSAYHHLENLLIIRRKELSKTVEGVRLNTPVGYLIDEFRTLLRNAKRANA